MTYTSLKAVLRKLNISNGIYTVDDKYDAEYVFLCTGSQPTRLDVHDAATQQIIDYDSIMNDNYVEIDEKDRFAVFGSSHSAMLAIMNLTKYTKKNYQLLSKGGYLRSLL